MAALLAILMFVLFAGLDWYLSTRKARRAAAVPATVPAPLAEPGLKPAAEPVWIGGYELPSDLLYHPGHTWVRPIGADMAEVGITDFARRLTGSATRVKLPGIGTWLLQGGKGFRLEHKGREANFLAPIEGEVVEVNPQVKKTPSVGTEDPYGRGWLFRVRSANLRANLRNLISGSLAKRWMQDAREQLELRLMALSGSVLQDGGEPAADFSDHLEDEDWSSLVEQFLLTRGGR